MTANGADGTYGGCYIGQLAGGASPTVTVTGSGASQINGTGNMTLVSTIFDVEDVTGNNATDLTVSLSLQNMTGISFTGNVQIDGAVTKTGAGTLTLSATNSYTGATTVSAGILSLGNGTNNTALDDAADMIVATGAVLNLNYTGTDTIDELSLGGALQTPGIWGASGSGATFINDSFFSGDDRIYFSEFFGGVEVRVLEEDAWQMGMAYEAEVFDACEECVDLAGRGIDVVGEDVFVYRFSLGGVYEADVRVDIFEF